MRSTHAFAAPAAGGPIVAPGALAHHHEDGVDPQMSSTLMLRIVAALAILAAALLCGLPPLFMKTFQSTESAAARIARAFGGGVIIALSLIHVLPEGIEMMSSLTDFPVGALLAVAGVVTLLAIDYIVTAAMAPDSLKQQLREAVRICSAPAAAPAPATVKAADVEAAGACKAVNNIGVCGSDEPHVRDPNEAAATPCRSCATAASVGAGVPSHPASLIHSHHHAPDSPITSLRQLVACYTLEAGCVFHSVIIGVGIGVLVDNPAALQPLIAAMVFHQALEGVALGAVLAAVKAISRGKKALMILIYSLTMPLGIVIGIAVSSSYNPESPVAAGVQGALSAFSAGLLLHIGMFSMVGEELSRQDVLVRPWLAAGLFTAIILGAGSMAIIALWG